MKEDIKSKIDTYASEIKNDIRAPKLREEIYNELDELLDYKKKWLDLTNNIYSTSGL